MEFNKELLGVLACPLDHSQLKFEESKLICTTCGKTFPIKDGIVDMNV